MSECMKKYNSFDSFINKRKKGLGIYVLMCDFEKKCKCSKNKNMLVRKKQFIVHAKKAGYNTNNEINFVDIFWKEDFTEKI